MGKPKNPIRSHKLTVTTTLVVRRYLEKLVLSGLFGKNAPEAAERLLARALEDLVDNGKLDRLRPGGAGSSGRKGQQ